MKRKKKERKTTLLVIAIIDWQNANNVRRAYTTALLHCVAATTMAVVAIVNVFIVITMVLSMLLLLLQRRRRKKMKLKMFHWLTIRKRKIQKSPLNSNLNRSNALFRLMGGWNLFISLLHRMKCELFLWCGCMFWMLFFDFCEFIFSRKSTTYLKRKMYT